MAEKLRTRAERKAGDLQQTIELTEAEIRELNQIVAAMLTRMKEGTVRVNTSPDLEKEELAARVAELEKEVAEERRLRERAEATPDGGQAGAEMDTLKERVEAAEKAQAESEERADTSDQAAEESRALAQRNYKQAAKAMAAKNTAISEAQRNASAVIEAKRNAKRAQELERIVESQRAELDRIHRIVGRVRTRSGPTTRHNAGALPQEVVKAYATLQIEPPSSEEELNGCKKTWGQLLHSDRQQNYGMGKEGNERLSKLNRAAQILEEHFRNQNRRRTA